MLAPRPLCYILVQVEGTSVFLLNCFQRFLWEETGSHYYIFTCFLKRFSYYLWRQIVSTLYTYLIDLENAYQNSLTLDKKKRPVCQWSSTHAKALVRLRMGLFRAHTNIIIIKFTDFSHWIWLCYYPVWCGLSSDYFCIKITIIFFT